MGDPIIINLKSNNSIKRVISYFFVGYSCEEHVKEVEQKCPSPTEGIFPNCTTPPCPHGFTGAFPECKKVKRKKCRRHTVGIFPNCFTPPCPPGYAGTYPNCKRLEGQLKCPLGSSGVFPKCEPASSIHSSLAPLLESLSLLPSSLEPLPESLSSITPHAVSSPPPSVLNCEIGRSSFHDYTNKLLIINQ